MVARLLLASALVLCALRASDALTLPGYQLDEEITAAVVPSISQHLVPRLPSGLLYVRGLPFNYAAWVAGRGFGDTVITYRWVSLVFGLAAIAAIYWAASLAWGPLAGGTAALILSSMDAFVASAAFARPYSLLAAAICVTLALFFRAAKHRSSPWPFLAGVIACRLLHEFGTALVCLPLIHAFILDRRDTARRDQFRLFWQAAAIAAGLEAALFAVVHYSLNQSFVPLTYAPAFRPLRFPRLPPFHLFEVGTALSITFMVIAPLVVLTVILGRRTRNWFVVVVAGVLAATFQLGGLLAWTLIACLLRPERARQILTIGGIQLVSAAVLLISHTVWMSSMQATWSLAAALTAPMLRYPLAGVLDVVHHRPEIAVAWTLGALLMMRFDVHTTPMRLARSVAIFSVLVVLGLDVMRVTSQPRFWVVAYPALVLTAAVGLIRVSAAASTFAMRVAGWRVDPAWLLAIVLALAIAPQAAGTGARSTFASVSPSIPLQAGDIIVCSEELACRYLLGRVDYLLLVHQTDLVYYTGLRNGQPRGLYANSPVLSSAESLEALVASTQPGQRVVVIIPDTGKVFELECLAAANAVAARYGERAYRTQDTDVFYLRRDAAGIAPSDRRAPGDLASTTPAIRPR